MNAQTRGSAAAPIRWGRILVAAIASEVGVTVAIALAFGIYVLLSPPMTDARLATLGEDVGYYVAPTAAAVMTVLAALWATRPLTSAFVLHGSLVGIVAVVMTAGFILGARPEHRVMYVISFALRLVAGYVGGVMALSKFRKRAARTVVVNESV